MSPPQNHILLGLRTDITNKNTFINLAQKKQQIKACRGHENVQLTCLFDFDVEKEKASAAFCKPKSKLFCQARRFFISFAK
jgi:hypothetical protein